MAIKLTAGGNGFIKEAGEKVLLKVTKVDYKPDFGKINITLANENGESITNNFTITKNGQPNEKALAAFSFFARKCIGGYVEEVEPSDLEGKFILADIVMNPGSKVDEDGNPVLYANLSKTYEANGKTFGSAPKSVVAPVEIDDEDWD